MKNRIKILLITVLIILILTTIVYAASADIKLETEKVDNTVIMNIKLDKIRDAEQGIIGFAAFIDYDKNAFETITENDIISQNNWTDIMYNETTGKIAVLRDNFTNNKEDIIQIKLTKKADVNIVKTKIKLNSVQVVDAKQEINIGDKVVTIRFSGITFGEILLIIVILIALLFVIRIIIRKNKKRRIRR